MVASSQVYALDELNKETTFGGAGRTKSRAVPQIDMSDFAARKERDCRAAVEAPRWRSASSR